MSGVSAATVHELRGQPVICPRGGQSAQRRALTSLRRSSAMKRGPAIPTSRRPRSAATRSDLDTVAESGWRGHRARRPSPVVELDNVGGFRIVAGRRAKASRWRSAPAQARYPTTPLPSPTRRAIRLRLQADGVQPLGRRRPPRRISSRPSRPAPVNGSAGTGSTAELLVAGAVKEARSLPARSWSATSSSPGVGSA